MRTEWMPNRRTLASSSPWQNPGVAPRAAMLPSGLCCSAPAPDWSRHRGRAHSRAVVAWVFIAMLVAAGGGMRDALAAEELSTVTVEADQGDRFEHESVAFLVKRTGELQNALDVSVQVVESGAMVDDADEGLRTVTIGAADDSKVLMLRIVDDARDESHSTVTVVVKSAPHYRVGKPGQASTRVRDNDGKLIELAVDPLERIVDEGQTAMFDLVATTVADGTFEEVGDLARVFGADNFFTNWSTRAVSEADSPDDYMVLSEVIRGRFGDFEREEPRGAGMARQSLVAKSGRRDGGSRRFVMREALPGIPVSDDTAEEAYERFLVRLESSAFLDSRIGFGTRRNISGLQADLSGSGFFAGVVMIRGEIDDLRLVDGSVAHEGRLEIYHEGLWGTVCDDYWTDVESAVACRQLGFPGAESNTGRFLAAHFGQGSGPIWLDNVFCEGSELRLIDCPRQYEGEEIGGNNCTHGEDVGIRCLEMGAANSAAPRIDETPASVHRWPDGGDPSSIVALDAANQGVTDLGGLAPFTGLERLNLAGNAIDDVAALAGLTNLKRLDLAGNSIADIGPLAGLENLRYLNLSGNRISDLSPLSELQGLEVVVLENNAIEVLAPLTHLVRLRYLLLAGNGIEDITPLADMSVLERLDLYGNPLVDTSPLGDLGSLVWLRLPGDKYPIKVGRQGTR